MKNLTRCEQPYARVPFVWGKAGGYSVIELLVVLGIIGMLSAVSFAYLYNYTRMYKTEDQAIKVMDLMREAAQTALNRRRTVRFELDVSNVARPVVRLIDENGTNPDILMKTIPLEPLKEVRMDVAPSGVARPNPPNYADAGFVGNVFSARFRSDGSVVNAADNPISATLYSWRPISETAQPFSMSNLTPKRIQETRAITVFGGSGAVRYWKHNGTTFVPYQ